MTYALQYLAGALLVLIGSGLLTRRWNRRLSRALLLLWMLVPAAVGGAILAETQARSRPFEHWLQSQLPVASTTTLTTGKR